MEILEYFDEYMEPWKILSRDMSEDLAKAYLDKLCYDKDSPILNGASKTDVLNSITATIGIGRMKTFIHTLVSLTQMRHLAVDAALSRVECEKFYIENKEGIRKRTTRQRTAIDDRMDGIFAALKADSSNVLDFSLLNKLNPEEKTYRIHCIALRLFCTLWMKCYANNHGDAAVILPLEFVVYSAVNEKTGKTIVFHPEHLFGNLIKSTDKSAMAQGIDETSITYFLTAETIDKGFYSKTALIEVLWNNIMSSPTARKYLDALSNHIMDITSPVTKETNMELLMCDKDYDTLSTLHDLASFTSIEGVQAALASNEVKSDKKLQEVLVAFLNSLEDVNTEVQQLNITSRNLGDEEVSVVNIVYGDAPLTFTLDELEDKLIDQVAIIPTLVDKGDNTYAICECEYKDFLADPENQSYWQPANDLLYFKYIKQQARTIRPQMYDVAQYLIQPDAKFDNSYIENLGASLIKPTLKCHKCGKLMLPTANFLAKLSLAARNDQISTGGQLSATPLKNADGFILNHTANAIAQKMNDLNKTSVNRDVSKISWPEVVAVGSKHAIEITNIFTQPAYADYFAQIAKSAAMTQANQLAVQLETSIAKIVEAGKRSRLGYSKLDYLYTLVSLSDDKMLNMKVLATQSRIYYGAETMLAYILQAIAAITSKLYNTNVYDKMDMPFGYNNILPLLEDIYSPAECITQLGFSSLDEIQNSVCVTGKRYEFRNTGVTTDTLFPVEIPVDLDDTSENAPTTIKEPSVDALIKTLRDLELFYTDLRDMAHAERNHFFESIKNAQSRVECIYSLDAAKDVDNILSAGEISILNRSAADSEFWSFIDADRYAKLIFVMADGLTCNDISSKAKVISHNIVTSLSSTDRQSMYLKLNADAIGHIRVDVSTELPSLSCLHHIPNTNPDNVYEYLVATYISACGLLEDIGPFLADEAADFAVKIYYECVVSDAVSSVIKKSIANNVTTEAYYCTGGLGQ